MKFFFNSLIYTWFVVVIYTLKQTAKVGHMIKDINEYYKKKVNLVLNKSKVNLIDKKLGKKVTLITLYNLNRCFNMFILRLEFKIKDQSN